MKAVYFDVDDTLYDQTRPFFDALTDVGIDIPGEDRNALFVKSRKYSDEVFEPSRRGEITMEQMYIYRITKTLADYGIFISEEKALQFQACYQERQKQLRLSEEIIRILEELQDKVVLGVITNGPGKHQRDKIRRLGLCRWMKEENMIISGELDITKPDPAIFVLAAERARLKPVECVYIGDSYENDVVGAARAGMRTVWFNRRRKTAEGEIRPDDMVYSEQELHRLLTQTMYL